MLLTVSCSIFSFLTWDSETNQTVFLKIWPDIWMLKRVKILQHFSKNFIQLKIFLVHVTVSYFSPLHQRSYSSCSKWLKYYIKMLILKLSAALLYRSGGVRNYFLCKAPIYLPTEYIKPFGQNVWSIQTWEPWLYIIILFPLFLDNWLVLFNYCSDWTNF